jgi:hypothetical protein
MKKIVIFVRNLCKIHTAFTSAWSVLTLQFCSERGTTTHSFKIVTGCLNLLFSYVTHTEKCVQIHSLSWYVFEIYITVSINYLLGNTNKKSKLQLR